MMMITDTDAKWPFFNKYHDNCYIKSHDTRQFVVLKESRESREYRLENKSAKDVIVYKIDGGLIDNNDVLKCDYGIFTEDNTLYFIEFKGADYIHALEQLLSTINILVVRPQVIVDRLNGRVVLSKMNVPAIVSTQEKKLTKLLKEKNGGFIKQCHVLKETI